MLNTNTLNHIGIQKVHSENWSGLVVRPSATSDRVRACMRVSNRKLLFQWHCTFHFLKEIG